MRREDAIAKFGVSYGIEAVPVKKPMTQQEGNLYRGIHNVRVVEYLGRDTASHATPEEALKAATDEINENMRSRLAELEKWEKSPKLKFKIAAAHMGLKREGGEYLERVQVARDAIVAIKSMLAKGAASEVKKLPDEIRLPVLLEQGHKIYRVEAYYLQRAMDVATTPVTEHEIKSITLRHNYFSDDKYDYEPEYHLDNGEYFRYPVDEASNEPIETSIVNYRYFLSKEAALENMRGIATRITEAMKPYL